MSKMSDYLEKKLLDHVLTNTAYTPPTDLYIGLFTTDPLDAGTGTEVTGGAYARQKATFGAASAPGGTSTTTADITFPIATTDWGTITHVGVFDDTTGGNLLLHGALETARTINTDNQLIILTGELTVVFS